MIPLGLRLVLSGGREAVTRLVVLTIAVGLGVGLLLTALAATSAVGAWNTRHAWFWTGTSSVPAGPATGAAPLWWHPSGDLFNGQQINRFDVAATGASSPVPPGIPHDPAPGQYYASPALAALLRSTPADELASRYPGHLAGTIGDAALPSPNSLVIIIGRTPAQLAATPNTARVTSIATALPEGPGAAGGPGRYSIGVRRVNGRGAKQLGLGGPNQPNPNGLNYIPPGGGIQASGIDLILSIVALAVLAPVLIFIATATRLSAARREQRFAAMRLVGATRDQVSLLAAVESTAAALLGMAAGFGIFFLLRTPVAGIPFVEAPLFPAEMTLSSVDIVAVAVGVPVAAAVAARLALRRVHISPLGVTRRTTPPPPRLWRVLPLLAGLAELGFWTVHGHPASIPGQIGAFVSSFLLIIVGLIFAGPWLTMAAASGMARWTSRPGTLIAARRLADDPRAAFRAVSGLVLALFVTTVAVVAITTQDAKNGVRWGTVAEAHVVTDQFADQESSVAFQGTEVSTGTGPAAAAAPLSARLLGIHGVRGVMVVRAVPGLIIPGTFHNIGANPAGQTMPVPAGVVSCAQLASVPALGRCPAGAIAAAFPEAGFSGPLFGLQSTAGITWPAAKVPASRLDSLRVDSIDVATNGSVPAIERARTALEDARAYPTIDAPSSIADLVASSNTKENAYQQLANTVILVSLPIAGCTLAAGVAAGLADRKRPFSLLRLTGARLAMLRRVVALESAVPLLAVATIAIGAGFGAAAMYASLQQGRVMVAPGASYYLITAGGLLVSLGIIAATFPLLARITGPDVARNE